MREQRSAQNPDELLNKYFEEIDIHKMKPSEKMLSAFGQHHTEESKNETDAYLNNGEVLHEFLKPVEGLDYYIEDSKEETHSFQTMKSELQEFKVSVLIKSENIL